MSAITDTQLLRLPDLMRHDDSLARLLWTRQRKLINYQYHSPGRDAVPAAHFLPSGDELSCVTMVQLRNLCKNDCEQAGTILKRTPRATSLAVAVSRLDLEMNSELYSCSRVVIGRFVVETIFRMAYAQHGQLKLTALRFDTICLERVGDRLQEFIALEGLQHLQLLRCSGNDSFLQVLSDKCYDLQSFVVEECRDVAHNNAINDFLRATTPRQLVYRSEHCGASSASAQGLITFDALFPFAHAIQGLVLRDCDPNFSVYGPQRTGGSLVGFEELCKSLQSLKLLCIASPAVDKMHWAIGGLTDFLVSTYESPGHAPQLTINPGSAAALAPTSSPEACRQRLLSTSDGPELSRSCRRDLQDSEPQMSAANRRGFRAANVRWYRNALVRPEESDQPPCTG